MGIPIQNQESERLQDRSAPSDERRLRMEMMERRLNAEGLGAARVAP
jgi:hypothetical protein